MSTDTRASISFYELTTSNPNLTDFKEIIFTDEQIEINRNSPLVFTHCDFKKVKIINIFNITFDHCQCETIVVDTNSVLSFSFQVSTITSELLIDNRIRNINLDGSIIAKLKLKGERKDHHERIGTYINLCTFDELTLSDLTKDSHQVLQITLCIVNKKMNILNSILDKVEFNGLDLSKSELTILNSSIVKASYYSITWPKNSRIVEKIESLELHQMSEGDILKLKEVYRQLKVLSIESHNKLDAIRFLSNELRIYERQMMVRTFGQNSSIFRLVKIVGTFCALPIAYPILKLIDLYNSLRNRTVEERNEMVERTSNYFSNFSDWLILNTNKTFSNFGE